MTDKPRTPVHTLLLARDIGLSAGLRYVYTGNIVGGEGENTSCPACGAAVIQRVGFSITNNSLRDGKCGQCGAICDGIFS
jgi:pyruvate formate lyase activating enzyme